MCMKTKNKISMCYLYPKLKFLNFPPWGYKMQKIHKVRATLACHN